LPDPFSVLVPEARIELARAQGSPDFESGASTNFTTPAKSRVYLLDNPPGIVNPNRRSSTACHGHYILHKIVLSTPSLLTPAATASSRGYLTTFRISEAATAPSRKICTVDGWISTTVEPIPGSRGPASRMKSAAAAMSVMQVFDPVAAGLAGKVGARGRQRPGQGPHDALAHRMAR
jgi:hypothetical protein